MQADVIHGDVMERLRELEDESIQICCTSPPYFGLRCYNAGPKEIGREGTVAEYVAKMVEVFSEVKRVLARDGVLFLNLGDSYASDGGSCRNPGGGNQSMAKRQKEAGCFPLNRPNKSDLEKQGLKAKDLCMVPARVAIALQDDGWYIRSDIIWSKPNPQPESVKDRPSKSHEYIFMLTKSAKYYWDAEAIAEPMSQEEKTRRLRESREGQNQVYDIKRNGTTGLDKFGKSSCITNKAARGALAENGTRNRRTVWTIPTQGSSEEHYASFPEEIPRICILAASRVGDTVLDPFAGTATVGAVAIQLQRNFIGIELSPEYVLLARRRMAAAVPKLFDIPRHRKTGTA